MITRDCFSLVPTDFNPAKQTLRLGVEPRVIRLCPGLLDRQLFFHGLVGKKGAPVVIEPHQRGWIDVGQRPDPRAVREDFIFLHLKECRHVAIRDLHLANAWPTCILLDKCEDITIEGCHFRAGKEAIYAKNSRRLLVRGCQWTQDTSPGHDLWHRIDWVEAHGGEGGNDTFAYFNGAFLGGKSLESVCVERNVIRDAYNGIRLKGEGKEPRNNDVTIAGNTFLRIRDNPIEPERYAFNWHIYHNEIIDAHGWLSFDGVGGGYIYVYGNLGRFVTRQGSRTSPQHTMGRVLKLSFETCNPMHRPGEVTPTLPWYVFNNSFFLRCPLIGGAACSVDEPDLFGIGPDITNHLTFANNVFEWCEAGEHDDYTATWIELVRNFRKRPEDGVVFDGSLSNRWDYFEAVSDRYGWEENGQWAEGKLFEDGPGGDLRLRVGSPGLESAMPLTIRGPDKVYGIVTANGRIDRGAWQGDSLVRIAPAAAV
ncbi:MAG: right-handed parallel beta-helix repeat-containing protein [Pseudooceanicola sp.]|nr:right-handed parallel beta-helix repeat-containing protein [Pseudooceanicola sp.]